jgi:hypothetical protein
MVRLPSELGAFQLIVATPVLLSVRVLALAVTDVGASATDPLVNVVDAFSEVATC